MGAPPLEETFVINLGNIMQIWSNGRFSSTPHRVINRSNRDRFSIPLFVNPSADVSISPLIDFDCNHSTTFNYGTYQRDLWRHTFPVAKSLFNPIHPSTSKAWFIIQMSIRQTRCRQ